jgi:hypothetical protein
MLLWEGTFWPRTQRRIASASTPQRRSCVIPTLFGGNKENGKLGTRVRGLRRGVQVSCSFHMLNVFPIVWGAAIDVNVVTLFRL